MTQLQTIEGTWEELIRNYSTELAGHRVKITILPEEETHRLDQALAGLLEEVDALEAKEPDLVTDNELLNAELFGKYRKQGFVIWNLPSL